MVDLLSSMLKSGFGGVGGKDGLDFSDALGVAMNGVCCVDLSFLGWQSEWIALHLNFDRGGAVLVLHE